MTTGCSSSANRSNASSLPVDVQFNRPGAINEGKTISTLSGHCQELHGLPDQVINGRCQLLSRFHRARIAGIANVADMIDIEKRDAGLECGMDIAVAGHQNMALLFDL